MIPEQVELAQRVVSRLTCNVDGHNPIRHLLPRDLTTAEQGAIAAIILSTFAAPQAQPCTSECWARAEDSKDSHTECGCHCHRQAQPAVCVKCGMPRSKAKKGRVILGRVKVDRENETATFCRCEFPQKAVPKPFPLLDEGVSGEAECLACIAAHMGYNHFNHMHTCSPEVAQTPTNQNSVRDAEPGKDANTNRQDSLVAEAEQIRIVAYLSYDTTYSDDFCLRCSHCPSNCECENPVYIGDWTPNDTLKWLKVALFQEDFHAYKPDTKSDASSAISDLSPHGQASALDSDRLQKIREIADLGSARELGDAMDRLEAIVKIAG